MWLKPRGAKAVRTILGPAVSPDGGDGQRRSQAPNHSGSVACVGCGHPLISAPALFSNTRPAPKMVRTLPSSVVVRYSEGQGGQQRVLCLGGCFQSNLLLKRSFKPPLFHLRSIHPAATASCVQEEDLGAATPQQRRRQRRSLGLPRASSGLYTRYSAVESALMGEPMIWVRAIPFLHYLPNLNSSLLQT